MRTGSSLFALFGSSVRAGKGERSDKSLEENKLQIGASAAHHTDFRAMARSRAALTSTSVFRRLASFTTAAACFSARSLWSTSLYLCERSVSCTRNNEFCKRRHLLPVVKRIENSR
jgi:hypothetical protein